MKAPFIRYTFPIVLTLGFLAAGCSQESNPVNECAKAPEVFLKEQVPGNARVSVSIRIDAGLSQAPPSYALWARYPDGTVESIYATCKASLGYPGNPASYSESLPVWYGIRESEGLTPGTPGLDAITTATPTRDVFSIRWEPRSGINGDTVQLFLEANMPNDYNDYFNTSLGTNGQPSLIWFTSFVWDSDSLRIVRPTIIVGRSDPKGKSSSIFSDRNGITSAQNIIEALEVKTVR